MFGLNAQACVCMNPFLRIDSLSQLKQYDFIAYVKIIDDNDYKNPAGNGYETIGQLTFEIVELFKGDKIDRVLEYSKNSSCDIGISKGEEWILFARMDKGKMVIDACDRNEKYRETNGLRDWKYDDGFYELRQLRQLYQHPVKKYWNDKREEQYSNGQKEIEETYVNGRLNGERKIWYPNGILFCKQNYTNDTLDGKSEWFYPSGQIYDEDYYIKGQHCNVSRLYYDSTKSKDWFVDEFKTGEDSIYFTSQKIQVQYQIVFDSYGRAVISREYDRFGRIDKEETIDPDKQFRTVIFYHDNGAISSIMYSLKRKNFGHYQEYDEKGFPKRGWDYDENGDVIKDK
jgi:antitoxin component YwqK of YwqJK toxin-antitoxin module